MIPELKRKIAKVQPESDTQSILLKDAGSDPSFKSDHKKSVYCTLIYVGLGSIECKESAWQRSDTDGVLVFSAPAPTLDFGDHLCALYLDLPFGSALDGCLRSGGQKEVLSCRLERGKVPEVPLYDLDAGIGTRCLCGIDAEYVVGDDVSLVLLVFRERLCKALYLGHAGTLHVLDEVSKGCLGCFAIFFLIAALPRVVESQEHTDKSRLCVFGIADTKALCYLCYGLGISGSALLAASANDVLTGASLDSDPIVRLFLDVLVHICQMYRPVLRDIYEGDASAEDRFVSYISSTEDSHVKGAGRVFYDVGHILHSTSASCGIFCAPEVHIGIARDARMEFKEAYIARLFVISACARRTQEVGYLEVAHESTLHVKLEIVLAHCPGHADASSSAAVHHASKYLLERSSVAIKSYKDADSQRMRLIASSSSSCALMRISCAQEKRVSSTYSAAYTPLLFLLSNLLVIGALLFAFGAGDGENRVGVGGTCSTRFKYRHKRRFMSQASMYLGECRQAKSRGFKSALEIDMPLTAQKTTPIPMRW